MGNYLEHICGFEDCGVVGLDCDNCSLYKVFNECTLEDLQNRLNWVTMNGFTKSTREVNHLKRIKTRMTQLIWEYI
jgi:hypothetical protein